MTKQLGWQNSSAIALKVAGTSRVRPLLEPFAMMPSTMSRVLGLLAVCVGLTACQNDAKTLPEPTTSAAPSVAAVPSGSAAAAPPSPFPVAIPRAAAEIGKIVNPKNEAPYAGPKAKLTGTIRIKGDPAPSTNFTFPQGKCGEAAATYGKLFRVGLEGAAADVLVAVTGYKGFVPARDEAEKLTIHGCAYARRTMALALGQRIEISNLDKIETYMPYVDGAPKKAVIVAVPGGAPVKLYAMEPGHYVLRDELPNPFLTADVFVLAYATHDVTGLDGKYEISDIPPGEVRVSAFLPAIDKVVEQTVTLKEGDNALDLTLEYDVKKAAAGDTKGEKKAPEKK